MGIVYPTAEILSAWGIAMPSNRGRVISRQKCRICGTQGKYQIKDMGGIRVLMCACCGRFPANIFAIEIQWQKRLHRITHDQAGRKFANLQETETALGLIRQQIQRKEFYPEEWKSARSNKYLWQNYLQEYLKREAARLLPHDRKGTYDRKVSHSKHMTWFNGKNIKEIRTAQIRDYAALPCLSLCLADKTISDLMGELRHIFRDAFEREDIKKLPIFPTIEVPEREIRWYSSKEQAAMLEKIPEKHLPIFTFLSIYGMRPGEACALMTDKVDRAKGVFHLTRTLGRSRQIQDKTKTKKADAMPIVDWFDSYLEALPPSLVPLPVFQNPEANPGKNPLKHYKLDALTKIFKKAIKEAGLPGITLHEATRSSLAMQLYHEKGHDIEAVRAVLRHRNLAHTGRYAQADTQKVRSILSGNHNR
jgi:integrase